MMKQAKKPYDLRNIKKNPSGYQIQFIVDGVSHSKLEKNLNKAKRIRNKMEIELKVAPKGAFRSRYVKNKMSLIPGTDKPMPPGITLHCYQHQGSKSYNIIVNWHDHTDKRRVKTFYGCSETTYTLKAMKSAYRRALAFRKAYEKCIIKNTLEELDPSAFNKENFKK